MSEQPRRRKVVLRYQKKKPSEERRLLDAAEAQAAHALGRERAETEPPRGAQPDETAGTAERRIADEPLETRVSGAARRKLDEQREHAERERAERGLDPDAPMQASPDQVVETKRSLGRVIVDVVKAGYGLTVYCVTRAIVDSTKQ